MFDVYLDNRRNLLVLKKGAAIPPGSNSGTWRKCRKRAVLVSDEIRSAVHTEGYYLRKSSQMRKART